jgi:L-aspartate oxidase
MVFAIRAVEGVLRDKEGPDATGALLPLLDPRRAGPGPGSVPVRRLSTTVTPIRVGTADEPKARAALQEAMFEGAGVLRSEASLEAAAGELDRLAAEGVPSGETANLLTVARAIVASARARTESRGGHRRRDYPFTDPALSLRFVQ